MSIKDLFKPINLKSEDRIVRWAYLFVDRYNRPRVTSLCEVFWRSILLTPMNILGILAIYGALCTILGAVSYENWVIIPSILLLLIVFAGLFTLGAFLKNTVEEGDLVDKFHSLTLVKGFKAIKSKYCPIVYID